MTGLMKVRTTVGSQDGEGESWTGAELGGGARW
jgi:hypothetical protein